MGDSSDPVDDISDPRTFMGWINKSESEKEDKEED